MRLNQTLFHECAGLSYKAIYIYIHIYMGGCGSRWNRTDYNGLRVGAIVVMTRAEGQVEAV